MPLFRRKPGEVVEHNQYVEGQPLPRGVQIEDKTGKAYVMTIHKQKAYVSFGDWIAPEPGGEYFYPIINPIHEERFEYVNET